MKYEVNYFILRDEEVVLDSAVEVELSEKEIEEIEAHLKEHDYPWIFCLGVPTPIYEKCYNSAFYAACEEFPDYAEEDSEYVLEFGAAIPDSILAALSEEAREEIRWKIPTDIIEYG